MTREQYKSLHLKDLRDIAKRRGIKRTSTMRKPELIEAMAAMDEQEEAESGDSRNTDVISEMPEKTAAEMPGPADAFEEPRTFSAQEEKRKPEEGKEEKTAAKEEITAEPSEKTEKKYRRRGNSNENKRTYHRDNSRKGRNAGTRKGNSNGHRPESRVMNEEENHRQEHSSGNRETGSRMEARTSEARTEYHEALENNRRHGVPNHEPNQILPGGEQEHGTFEKNADSRRSVYDYGSNRGGHSRERNPYLQDEEQESHGFPDREEEFEDEPEYRGEWENRDERPAERIREKSAGSHGDTAYGILEVMQDGYGFLRSDNFLSGEHDVYVSPSQIRRFRLRTGDLIEGSKRERGQGEKFGALLHVDTVNGLQADEIRGRSSFEKMTPIFPNRRIRLERPDGSRATRIVDLISPIGYGQRGMIVSPPKAGKTTLLKDIAKSILTLNPEQHLIILLIDERPEEVTDMRETVHGVNVDIVASTFDEQPEHHRRVAEMVIERAKRLVEQHEDVIILLDSITRLTRAYNVLVPQSGRTLSGGLDPTALYAPKKFFGAARNMREGGSLTILATALVDTGSKMDDVVYEEFKGTGNMELILDRKLQERRIFPAIDIVKSGTRRDDLLLTEKEEKAVTLMRRRLNSLKAEEAVEAVLNAFTHFPTNDMVVNAILSKWQ